MTTVQPIRDKQKIEEIKENLLNKNYRDYMLFFMGINTALRVSDLLKLKVKDFLNQDYLFIKEKKTGKNKRFLLTENVKKEINKYIKTLELKEDDYLFQSRNGENKPLQRVMAYNIINEACVNAGLKDNYGSHSLRKSYGFHFYQKYKDVAMLQGILNHSSPAITLKYIGISDELVDKAVSNFSL